MKITHASIKENEIKFETLRQAYHDELTKIIRSNINWHKDDARRWLFARFSTILFISTLNLYIEAEHLIKLNFWNKYLSEGDPQIFLEEGVEYYDRHARVSLVMNSVAALEHSYNIILKSANLAPKKINFYELYKKIIELTYNKHDFANAKKPFKLLRLIRNCHHNSWIHKSQNNHETWATITYKGDDYCFVKDEMPLFVSWGLLHDILKDILQVNILLINHPRISQIEHINDPGAMENLHE